MLFKHEPHIKNRYSTYKSIDFIITISEIIRKERRCFNTHENNYYLEVESGFMPKIQPLNIDVFDFTLTAEDMAAIEALDGGESLFFSHYDPKTVEWFMSIL